MKINRVFLKHFRNYSQESVSFGENVNILIGGNAQGKTNLLEAIYLSLRGKSFKAVRDGDLIQLGQESSTIKTDLICQGLEESILVNLNRNGKKSIHVNQKEIKSLKELLSLYTLVLFTPDDLKIIKESPGFRRAFMDQTLGGIAPLYIRKLQYYQKILEQRNQLLKYNQKASYYREQLVSLSKLLVESGIALMQERHQQIQNIDAIASSHYQKISGREERLEVGYETNLIMEDKPGLKLKQEFYQQLVKNFQKDQETGFTNVGPHKDDLLFHLNGQPARIFASQGQQRSIVLALKLAELDLLSQIKDLHPIVLLDDVFSELDERRTRFLLEAIDGYQSIITTNQPEHIPRPEGQARNYYQVRQGTIRPVEESDVFGFGK